MRQDEIDRERDGDVAAVAVNNRLVGAGVVSFQYQPSYADESEDNVASFRRHGKNGSGSPGMGDIQNKAPLQFAGWWNWLLRVSQV